MTGKWRQALLAELQQRQVVAAEAGARFWSSAQAAPWYVAALSGLAAWLAALMLLAAWVMALGNEPLAGLVAGGLLLIAAISLLRRSGPFVTQLGVAFSLLGQGLLVFSIAEMTLDSTSLRPPALVAAVVAAGMLWVRAGTAHRFLCALAALLGLVLLIDSYRLLSVHAVLMAVLATALWLQRGRWALSPHALLVRAIAGAATLVALGLGIIAEPGTGGLRWLVPTQQGSDWWAWFYPLGAAVLLLLTVGWLTRQLRCGTRWVCLAVTLALAALGSLAPGLVVAAALWLAVFHACDRFWCVIIGIGLAGYLGDLYYSLHITLLTKSMLLAATGVLLLMVRQWLVVPRRGHE